jgi:hypothetical protein
MNSDCGDGGMVCNMLIPRCASICTPATTGATCAPQNLYCNSMIDGFCVECLDNTYCTSTANGAYCYVAAGACGCQSNADCPSSHPTCGARSPTRLRFCH